MGDATATRSAVSCPRTVPPMALGASTYRSSGRAVADQEAPDAVVHPAQHVVDGVPELPHSPDEPGPRRALAGLGQGAHIPLLAGPDEQRHLGAGVRPDPGHLGQLGADTGTEVSLFVGPREEWDVGALAQS